MELPQELEALRHKKVWLCYPMIPKKDAHGGFNGGGYSKPPINPYTLWNGNATDTNSFSDFETANAQIGKTAHIKLNNGETIDCEVYGVGIALYNTGICGIDLDSVANGERRTMTKEAAQIIDIMNSYTELSPSGTGFHILYFGSLPDCESKKAKFKKDILKGNNAEYQFFESGLYMTVSGQTVGNRPIAERTEEAKEVYNKFFADQKPQAQPKEYVRQPKPSSVVSSESGFTWEKWLNYSRTLSTTDLLQAIFKSGSVGRKVEALYMGDMSDYNNDHSAADQALINYLYSFTEDRELTEALFIQSALYRERGKSRNYITLTINKAERKHERLIGHIEFTKEELKAYAQRKQKEEAQESLNEQMKKWCASKTPQKKKFT